VLFSFDFLLFELGFSVDFSVAESLADSLSALVDFSDFSDFVLGLLFELGLFSVVPVALSAAGLWVWVAAGDLLVAGLCFTVPPGVVLASGAVAEADGVVVAPTLPVAAGVALGAVELALLFVVPVVVEPVVVVPLVVVTPALKLGVTP
jgi:hypothetical protein